MQNAKARLETAELFAWTAATVIAAALTQLFLSGISRHRRLIRKNSTTNLTKNTNFLFEILFVRVVCGLFSFLKVNAHSAGHLSSPPPQALSVRSLSFSFGDNSLFENFSADLGAENPVAILGPSGCGKTTLLRLLAGLLKPQPSGDTPAGQGSGVFPEGSAASFVFQESRLLSHLTVLENVALPIKRKAGKQAVTERAKRFLELASLEDKAAAYPSELSGGQKQRASIARAFAYPAPIVFMDEPFQSLDIPLRLELMDMCAALLEQEKRLVIAVTHDPREAVYLGKRIIILGKPPSGIIFDETVNLSREERAYGSPAHARLEARLLAVLGGIR
jgi:NitT/TauT family transport system ATP-binding protein